MSLSLYSMTAEWQRIFDMLDDPEIPEEAVFDTIEMIKTDMEIKAENYAKIIRSLEADVKNIDLEICRLQDRKTHTRNRIAAMKRRLEDTMRTTGRLKFKTPLFSFAIQRNGGKAPVVITGTVPANWLKPGEPDMTAIRQELEVGKSLDFAHLGDRGESLRIR